MNAPPLLEIRNLSVRIRTRSGQLEALRQVSLQISEGETLAILGESGSGKSLTAMSVMGLLDPRVTTIEGEIRYRGTDLVGLSQQDLRSYRGNKISIVFQDALAALNPIQPVGSQIAEVIRAHTDSSRSAASKRAVEMMDRVRIPDARSRFGSYPHQFSGGMRQRIMIALALALGPDLLIADEPTTALDVTVQAQIIDMLAELCAEDRMSLMLITHDLSVAADIADRMAIMYAGRIVETGPADLVHQTYAHPYTAGLLRSVPRAAMKGQRLPSIPGSPPPLEAIPSGCSFHPRCAVKVARCGGEVPLLTEVGAGHEAACHLLNDGEL